MQLQRWGVLCGFAIALVGFGVAGWLGYLGHPATAAVVGGLDLTALVSVFVLGKYIPRADFDPDNDEGSDE